MQLQMERSYSTPLSNSSLLPLLLLSLTSQKHTPQTSGIIKDLYDFIIVGGGPAGSVVASRLSEDRNVNVLLVEAGPEPPLLTEVPVLGRYFAGTDLDWQFKTVPQKFSGSGLINRQIHWTTGKVLGGSATINGMAYVRGNRKDFDNWASQGAKGWSYNEIFHYFLMLEDNNSILYRLNGYHATGGPITVEQPKYNPELKLAVCDAAAQLGLQFVDPNAATQTGFYNLQANIRNNQRCSPVKGYLVPAENRENLDILINTMVTKIIIENGQATGVEIYSDGQVRAVYATREVIISAGTVNTPKILMLSGIGPREELQKFDIPVIADLPVGKNFHDHAGLDFPFTLDARFKPLDVEISKSENILEYIISRSGPLASTDNLIIAFLEGLNSESYTKNTIDLPDYEIYFGEMPISYARDLGWKQEVFDQFYGPYVNETIGRCTVQQLRPKSRGTVTLMSRNPFDPPVIDPNYLEVPSDIEAMVEGLKMCKRLLNTTSFLRLGAKLFKTLVLGCEMYADVDDAYFQCIARSVLFTFHHSVGTCKMGDSADPNTVVDPELRVKSVRGLRVVDASVMPSVTSGNTHIPVVMIAEKASDMIKASMSQEVFGSMDLSISTSQHENSAKKGMKNYTLNYTDMELMKFQELISYSCSA